MICVIGSNHRRPGLDSKPVAAGAADLKEGQQHAKHQCIRRG
jgi:hypothetical protein